MSTGTVSNFDDSKGYGFITPDSGGPLVFVQYADIQAPPYVNVQKTRYKPLEENQRVGFVIIQGPKGPMADVLRLI